ncbi:hypothetical protein [Microbispora sp. KK1-11]|nr:hypothetical protein [Microbispora sp. KK1-11]
MLGPTQLPTELAEFPADPGQWQAWLTESAHGSRMRAPMRR